MQDRPDKEALLDALGAFLAREVLPAMTDRALAFRVRVAAHLLSGLAREVRGEEELDDAHLRTLLALLGKPGEVVPASAAACRVAIRRAEAELAEHIRTAALDGDEEPRLRAGLRSVLAAKIAVGDPRFDTSDDIEGR